MCSPNSSGIPSAMPCWLPPRNRRPPIWEMPISGVAGAAISERENPAFFSWNQEIPTLERMVPKVSTSISSVSLIFPRPGSPSAPPPLWSGMNSTLWCATPPAKWTSGTSCRMGKVPSTVPRRKPSLFGGASPWRTYSGVWPRSLPTPIWILGTTAGKTIYFSPSVSATFSASAMGSMAKVLPSPSCPRSIRRWSRSSFGNI